MAKRSSELELDENSTFKTSCAEMRKKAESEVDLVRQKLKEEQSEKVELLVLAAEDKNKARWPCCIHTLNLLSGEYQMFVTNFLIF